MMRYCRCKDVRIGNSIPLFVWCPLLIVMIGKLYDLRTAPWPDIVMFSFFVVVIAVAGLFFGWLFLWNRRKYKLSVDGLTVAYFRKKPRTIPWSSIAEVAVCKVHYNTKLGWETVIRIVIGDVFKVPEYDNKIWAHLEFSMKYHKNIIIIDYNDAIREEFEKICPIPIRDCR